MLKEMSIQGLHDFLINFLLKNKMISKGFVLDLGAGSGNLGDKLMDLGFNVISVDKTKDFLKGKSKFVILDLNDEFHRVFKIKFDLIISVEVIEHLYSPIKFLENIYLLLKENGLAIITTPNVDNILSRIKFLFSNKLRQFDENSDPTHITPIFFYLFKEKYLRLTHLN